MKKMDILSVVLVVFSLFFSMTLCEAGDGVKGKRPDKDTTLLRSGHKFFKVKEKASATQKSESPEARTSKSEYKKNEVLVKFKKNVSQANIENVHKKMKAKVKKTFKKIGVQLVEIPKGMDVQKAITNYKKYASVKFAEPNYRVEMNSTTPNDPMFNDLWGLHNTGQTGGTADADIDAPEAWDSSQGDSSIVVGVVDSGVDYNHEDLQGNVWENTGEVGGDGIDNDGNGFIDDIHGWDAANGDGDPYDDNDHGTHVSGTIGAVGNNGVGVAGVNWHVKIMALKFLDAGGSGWISDAEECLNYVITMYDNGVNIKALNNSWGGGDYSSTFYDAIEALRSRGILFIAAAGNDDEDTDAIPHYPSSYPNDNVISVAATDHTDSRAWFSNYGATTVDVGAPGESILSTLPCTESFEFSCGTTLFSDDMESGSGNWSTSGTNNTWAVTEEESNSPTHAWSDSPNGGYLEDTDSYFTLASNLDLSGVTDSVALSFKAKYELEEYFDYLSAEVSGDGGATWQNVGYLNGYRSSWVSNSFLIPDSVKTTQFRCRFRLITDDTITYDGVYIDDVKICTVDVAFHDNMESGSGNWTTGGANNSWAITEEWAFDYSHSPTHGWSDSPDDDYLDDTDSYLKLANDIDLSGYAGDVVLGFILPYYDLEGGYDYLYVDISNDGGATWQTMKEFTYEGLLEDHRITIPSSYKTANFRCRFRLVTDDSVAGDGVYIDDVFIASGTVTQICSNYDWYSGTSMATPHVTGLSALLWAYRPTLSYTDVVDTIFATVDQLSDLEGKTVTCGRINANSALQQDPSAIPPIVTSFTPVKGDIGTTVTFEGRRFGSTAGTVVFNPNKNATITSWSDTSIVCTVPADATSGDVTITTDDGRTNTTCIHFTVACYYTLRASITTPVFRPAVASVNGKIYAIGGYDSSYDETNKVQIYDPATNTWTTGANKPTPAANAYAAVVNGKIYVPCGYQSSTGLFLDVLEIYDPSTDTWSSGSNVPQALSGLAAASVNGKLYIMGGYTSSSAVATVYEYDPATDTYTTKDSLNQARGYFAAGVIDGKIYVAGGYTDTGFTSSAEVYDPSTNNWTTLASMNTARYDFGGAAGNGKFYVFGGNAYSYWDSPFQDDSEEYDPASNTWTAGCMLNVARQGVGGSVVDEYLYATGGYNGSPLGTHERYFVGQSIPTPTPTPEASPTPTVEPTSTYVPTPTPTPSPSPSPTPQPSPTEPPTAVSLVGFEAKVNGDGSVTLAWETASEVDNAGFNIYRSKRSDGTYKKVNGKLIPAQGNGAVGASYSFEDTPGSGVFYYNLEDVDYNGTSAMHGPVKVRVRSAEGEAKRMR